MNALVLSFSLFLLWFGVALYALVIGKYLHPKFFADSSRMEFLGLGASALAVWNFVKW